MTLKAVILDLDGVVVDSELLVKRAQYLAFVQMGFDLKEEWFLSHTVGHGWESIFKLVHQQTHRTPDKQVIVDAKDIYIQLAETDLQPTPHIAEALVQLRGQGVKLCIASSSEPDKLATSLRVTNLAQHFKPEYLFSGTQVKHCKPAPDLYLFAAQQMDVDPEECIVVEDAAAGVTGARKAGIDVVGYTGGSHAKCPGYGQALLDAGAFGVLTSHETLPRLVAHRQMFPW